MQSDMPIGLLVSREWNGTKWHYPNIERMVEENKRLRAELAAAIKQRDEARMMWCRIISLTRRGAGEVFAPADIAVEYGWDCFAQQEGGGA